MKTPKSPRELPEFGCRDGIRRREDTGLINPGSTRIKSFLDDDFDAGLVPIQEGRGAIKLRNNLQIQAWLAEWSGGHRKRVWGRKIRVVQIQEVRQIVRRKRRSLTFFAHDMTDANRIGIRWQTISPCASKSWLGRKHFSTRAGRLWFCRLVKQGTARRRQRKYSDRPGFGVDCNSPSRAMPSLPSRKGAALKYRGRRIKRARSSRRGLSRCD